MTTTDTTAGTGTTAGARTHARAQEGAADPGTPRVLHPARRYADRPDADLPDGVGPDGLTWAQVVPGGGSTSLVVAAGAHVRLRDLGGACAHVLLFHADGPWERLNVADTVKVQWQAFLSTGHLLLSDQGRVLASIVEDTAHSTAARPRHDALLGTTTLARNTARYGDGTVYGPSPAGRELFALAGAKHGLTRRDLPPSVSFFQGVAVDDAGRPAPAEPGPPGAAVTLVAELPLVVLVANTAHPLDPAPEFGTGPLEVLAWPGRPTTPDDARWSATPEGRRAFENTHAHRTLRTTGGTR